MQRQGPCAGTRGTCVAAWRSRSALCEPNAPIRRGGVFLHGASPPGLRTLCPERLWGQCVHSARPSRARRPAGGACAAPSLQPRGGLAGRRPRARSSGRGGLTAGQGRTGTSLAGGPPRGRPRGPAAEPGPGLGRGWTTPLVCVCHRAWPWAPTGKAWSSPKRNSSVDLRVQPVSEHRPFLVKDVCVDEPGVRPVSPRHSKPEPVRGRKRGLAS